MNTARVIGGSVILYAYIDQDRLERVCVCAKLPEAAAKDWEGEQLYILDWKIENGIATLAYQTRNDAYAPIFDHKFPVVKEATKLQKPNRSKNWEWSRWDECWKNKKTGEKAYA